MKKQNKKGFTLVELLVVIAILAILATVSVVGYSQFTKKAKESNDNTELHQYATLLQAALVDGEEEVEVGNGGTKTSYKVIYSSTDKKVSIATKAAAATEDGTAEETMLAATVASIINTMLIDPTEAINGAHLYATLDSGKLVLYYQHHVAANDDATSMANYVNWEFQY